MAKTLSAVGDAERSCAGFVLLDLVVTAAIAGLLMAVIFAYLRPAGTTPTTMHILLDDTVSLLRSARTSAIAENSDTTFAFDAEHRLFWSGRARIFVPADIRVDMASGGGCTTDGAISQVIFYPDGTSCGAVLYFSTEARRYRLRVNWATGNVQILK